MSFRLTTTGERVLGVQIVDEATGENVIAKLGAKTLALRFEPGRAPVLEVEVLIQGKTEGLGWPEWFARNPRTGRAGKLAAMLFADGTVADLRGSGEEPLCFPDPGSGELE